MEQLLAQEVIRALSEGDLKRLIGYTLIFFVIWLEVRGLKKQLKNINDTMAKSFAAGERRFKDIETDVHQIRVDLDQIKIQGGLSGKTF